ncbi:MAG: DUF1616 domain-containing protein [Chloroflexi bacterium]|nr:DUF1616 domain-containing protein [Chloroflexota bacterium]
MDWPSPIRELFNLILAFLEPLPVIRAILGFILVFFLPGFAWTFIFFKQINVIERITLSLALSIVVVTISLLLANRAGVKITGFNAVLVIIIVTILPALVYFLNKRIRRKSRNAT